MLDRLPLKLSTCTLRPLKISDAGSIAELANNPKIAMRLRNVFPSPYSPSDAEKFITLLIRPDYGEVVRGIDFDGVVVGAIGIKLGEKGEVCQRTAEVGYWLGEPYWGRGIVTDVVRAFTDHVFERTELLRISANVFDGNFASCRVLEKAGFQKEGVMRAYVEKNEEILDAHLYAKLSPTLG